MEITKLTHSFKIENNGNITQHGFNSITAYINKDKDSITFKEGSKNIATAPIKNIKINGQQVTTDNIENLLEEMFLISSSNGGSGGSTLDQIQADWLNDESKSASYINNRPHSIIKKSKDFKLPDPACVGHIVEVMEQDKLYRTYQWNGWNWNLIGAEPNFIFKEAENEGEVSNIEENEVIYYNRRGDTSFVTLEKGKEYSNLTIVAQSIDSAFKDYIIGKITVISTDTNDNIIIPPLKTHALNILRENICNNVVISDCYLGNSAAILYSKNFVMKNNTALSTDSNIQVKLKSTNVDIENNAVRSLLGLEMEGCNSESTKDSTSTVRIVNNNFSYSFIVISPKMTDDESQNNNVDCHLTITGNKGINVFAIRDFKDQSEISSFNVDFDNSISRVDISNSIFSESALTSLIKALVNVPDNEDKEYVRDFKYKNSTPKLTDEQKAKLEDAKWEIEE